MTVLIKPLQILSNDGHEKDLFLRKNKSEICSATDMPSIESEVKRNLRNRFELQ